MDIYVRDTSYNLAGIIDTASSVIWTERYNEAGDFEIYIKASPEVVALLQKGYYLEKQDSDRVMVIEAGEVKTDTENGNYVTYSGRSLEIILERRIVWTQTNLSGTAEGQIRRLITENFISPSIAARKIPNMKLGDAQGFQEKIEMQVTGATVGETIKKICLQFGWGYKLTLENGNFVFSLYKGTDRSYSQKEVPYVTFSPEFDNLLNSDYLFNLKDYKNVALVAGEGEGINRRTRAVGTAEGLERREIYVDSRNTSSNDGEMTEQEYNAALDAEGTQTLEEHRMSESFEGEVNYQTPYTYKKDFFMGDIVEVVNEYGISATPRISEIIESEDESGHSIIPTFDYGGESE